MLRAILWAKAHIPHLEARRLETREDSRRPRRRKINESAHLIGRKPVGCTQEMDWQQCRKKSLSDLGRPEPRPALPK